MTNTKDIYADHDRMGIIPLLDIALMLSISISILQTICREHKIGMENSLGDIWLDVNDPNYSDGLRLLIAYATDADIGDKILDCIVEHQPISLYGLVTRLEIPREVVWRVLDALTLIDDQLWELKIEGNDYLFYGIAMEDKYCVDSGEEW